MNATQRILGVLTAAVLVVSACGGTSPPSGGAAGSSGSGGSSGPSADTIKVQLPAAHGARFAGYYAAMDQGFYGEAGFQVELIAGANEQAPPTAVGGGTGRSGGRVRSCE